MNCKLIGLTGFAVLLLGVLAQSAEHTKDKLEDIKKALAEDKAILIDVRELDEWNEGHIQNAKHLSLTELKQGKLTDKLKTLIPAGKVVYLHCAAGGRCLKAADLLKSEGYETRPLKPGYNDLIKAGFEKAK